MQRTSRPLRPTNWPGPLTLGLTCLTLGAAEPAKSQWQDHVRLDFQSDGRAALLVAPDKPAPGNPWIWRTEFFGHEPQADLALLRLGYYVAYVDMQNLYGGPAALDIMDRFYVQLRADYGLAPRVVLEGFSRGGLFALNWAARHPDRTAALYLDAPVCDFKSWPAGWGEGRGSPEDWARCKQVYGIDDDQARGYRLNPVDNLTPLAGARVPILSVCGDADDVVPLTENSQLLYDRYVALGGPMTLIIKPGVGHHPHSLKDPAPIVEFLRRATATDRPAPGELTAVSRRPDTVESREARLGWWRDAKFGLFVHWGPASLSGKEISWARIGHPHDHPGHETVPPETYDNLYREFNPVKFDADAWMQLARDAGMKYVVFITKHHDGFSLWPTKLRPDYSIAASPYRRDLCRQVADAARRHGLKLGWYYSTRDWTHPDYLVGDNRRYDEFYQGQVRELLTQYGQVDVLWFDHVAGNWRDYRFQQLFDLIYQLQPRILVNDRAARFIRATADQPPPTLARLVTGDFDTPEQRLGNYQLDRDWESCVTLTECADGGGWSYRPDGRTRTYQECVRMLVQCVTGGGNLLLNVGPLPTGEIDPSQVDVLRRIGPWLAKHGESIYATRGGPFPNGAWGGSTHRENRVYLHVMTWPKDAPLQLPPLEPKLLGATVLTGGTASVRQEPSGLYVDVPPDQRDPLDTIIRLELAGGSPGR